MVPFTTYIAFQHFQLLNRTSTQTIFHRISKFINFHLKGDHQGITLPSFIEFLHQTVVACQVYKIWFVEKCLYNFLSLFLGDLLLEGFEQGFPVFMGDELILHLLLSSSVDYGLDLGFLDFFGVIFCCFLREFDVYCYLACFMERLEGLLEQFLLLFWLFMVSLYSLLLSQETIDE